MSDNYQRDLEKQNEALRRENARLEEDVTHARAQRDEHLEDVERLGRQVEEARDQARAATKERDLTQQNYTEVSNALHECRQDCAGERAAFQRAMDEAISLKNERDEWKARAEKADADLEEEVARWQAASGLERGGDHGGVTPEMLERHILSLCNARMRAEAERDDVRRMHDSNVEAGMRFAAELDKAGVGNPRNGILTRASVALERLRAAEAVRQLAQHDAACDRDGYGKVLDVENCAVCRYDALKDKP